MTDYIFNGIAAGGTIRIVGAETTNTVARGALLHDTYPVASAALGRTLTAAILMAREIKNETDSINIQIKGNGPIGGILAVCGKDHKVRGYVNEPHIDLPLNSKRKLDVGGAVGKGLLTVVKDLNLKEPYIGCVALVTGEIGDDIAYYYATSEQIPSVVALGVLVDTDGSIKSAGGFLLQLMPGAGDDLIKVLEQRVGSLENLTQRISMGESVKNICIKLCEGYEPQILETGDCSYTCNCSRERMEKGLISLGRSEIEDIIHEQGEAELQCHFCNSKYYFSKEQLEELLKKI